MRPVSFQDRPVIGISARLSKLARLHGGRGRRLDNANPMVREETIDRLPIVQPFAGRNDGASPLQDIEPGKRRFNLLPLRRRDRCRNADQEFPSHAREPRGADPAREPWRPRNRKCLGSRYSRASLETRWTARSVNRSTRLFRTSTARRSSALFASQRPSQPRNPRSIKPV